MLTGVAGAAKARACSAGHLQVEHLALQLGLHLAQVIPARGGTDATSMSRRLASSTVTASAASARSRQRE